MKAKTLAFLSIVLLLVMAFSVAISADEAAKQDLYDAAYEACPANYRKYYMGTVENMLKQISVSRQQADAVIALIDEGVLYLNSVGDHGPSLSDYGVQGVQKGVSLFEQACQILNIGYTYTTLPDSVADHHGDQVITFTYNGKYIAAIDGDDLSSPSSGGSSGGVTYYSVSFETNGGSEILKQRVKRNSTLNAVDDPEKEGFKFAGWYIDENFKTPFDFSTKIKENMILYAKWIEATDPVEPEVWVNPYADVSEADWYYNDLKILTELGYINGISANEFGGNLPLTRGMFVTILHRIDGGVTASDCNFEDVIDGAWYEAGVNWASENGIVTGFNDKEFKPDISITREQMAAVLFRYARYKGMDAVTLQESLHFIDSDQISEYAVPAMNWATSVKIIRGHGDGTVTPLAYATRAHVTAVFVRLLEFMGAIR